jgi:hypothetical protein
LNNKSPAGVKPRGGQIFIVDSLYARTIYHRPFLAVIEITREAAPGIQEKIGDFPFFDVVCKGRNFNRVQMNITGEDGHIDIFFHKNAFIPSLIKMPHTIEKIPGSDPDKYAG